MSTTLREREQNDQVDHARHCPISMPRLGRFLLNTSPLLLPFFTAAVARRHGQKMRPETNVVRIPSVAGPVSSSPAFRLTSRFTPNHTGHRLVHHQLLTPSRHHTNTPPRKKLHIVWSPERIRAPLPMPPSTTYHKEDILSSHLPIAARRWNGSGFTRSSAHSRCHPRQKVKTPPRRRPAPPVIDTTVSRGRRQNTAPVMPHPAGSSRQRIQVPPRAFRRTRYSRHTTPLACSPDAIRQPGECLSFNTVTNIILVVRFRNARPFNIEGR